MMQTTMSSRQPKREVDPKVKRSPIAAHLSRSDLSRVRDFLFRLFVKSTFFHFFYEKKLLFKKNSRVVRFSLSFYPNVVI